MNISLPILFIDTSSDLCKVVVIKSEQCIVEKSGNVEQSHREELKNLVLDATSEAGIKASEISLIALASGPGSFTGLRIGYAFSKGLALANNIPIVTIPSFYFLASIIFATNSLAKAMLILRDARRSEYYCSAYMQDGNKLNELFECKILNANLINQEAIKIITTYNFTKSDLIIVSEDPKLSQSLQLEYPILLVPTCLTSVIYQSLMTAFSNFKPVTNYNEIAILEPLYVREMAAKTIAERSKSMTVDS